MNSIWDFLELKYGSAPRFRAMCNKRLNLTDLNKLSDFSAQTHPPISGDRTLEHQRASLQRSLRSWQYPVSPSHMLANLDFHTHPSPQHNLLADFGRKHSPQCSYQKLEMQCEATAGVRRECRLAREVIHGDAYAQDSLFEAVRMH